MSNRGQLGQIPDLAQAFPAFSRFPTQACSVLRMGFHVLQETRCGFLLLIVSSCSPTTSRQRGRRNHEETRRARLGECIEPFVRGTPPAPAMPRFC